MNMMTDLKKSTKMTNVVDNDCICNVDDRWYVDDRWFHFHDDTVIVYAHYWGLTLHATERLDYEKCHQYSYWSVEMIWRGSVLFVLSAISSTISYINLMLVYPSLPIYGTLSFFWYRFDALAISLAMIRSFPSFSASLPLCSLSLHSTLSNLSPSDLWKELHHRHAMHGLQW